MISIRNFIILTIVLLATIFYILFLNYQYKLKEKTTQDIVETVENLLGENVSAISNGLQSLDDINSFRSRISRTVNYSEEIKTILITQGDNIILSSDPSINIIPTEKSLLNYNSLSNFNINNDTIAYKKPLKFYENEVPIELLVYGIIDHHYIFNQLTQDQYMLISFLGLPPLILMILIGVLINFYIIHPLDRLKKYAYYDESGKTPGKFFLAELESLRDSLILTFNRLEQENQKLFKISTTDDLCGLTNRTALYDKLRWLGADADRTHNQFALIYIDLDHFKDVNDSLGHDAGDKLLIQISDSLKEIIRSNDILARLGGDEFVIVVNRESVEIELLHIIERVIQRIALPWIVENQQVNITCSIGVVIYGKDGKDAGTLLKNADIAMYEAKKNGRNNYHFFTKDLNERVQNEITMEREMVISLQSKDFELHYQPKIDLRNGRIIGSEALIRWNHPIKGMVPPNKFIPIAERNGFIIQLGNWVIEEAIKFQLSCVKEGLGDLSIAVNVSTLHLVSENFVENVKELINKYDFDPTLLDIEITENTLLNENTYDQSISAINKLRKIGVKFSLDDFGTGYSSLSYLKNLPIDNIKIDKSFVDDFNIEVGAVIIRSIIHLAKALNLEVVAEGVECPDQYKFLKNTGCDTLQGFYYSRPLPGNDFQKFVTVKNIIKHKDQD